VTSPGACENIWSGKCVYEYAVRATVGEDLKLWGAPPRGRSPQGALLVLLGVFWLGTLLVEIFYLSLTLSTGTGSELQAAHFVAG
jgi:hypothetical protein